MRYTIDFAYTYNLYVIFIGKYFTVVDTLNATINLFWKEKKAFVHHSIIFTVQNRTIITNL